MQLKHHSRLIGGILLVSGTTIGAAMLALPLATAEAGFGPSLLFFVGFWLFMTYTALLLLEVNLWMHAHTNLTSMAKKTLGKSGQIISWFIYLFLLYSLTTAYLAGSSPIFLEAVYLFTHIQLPVWTGPLPLLLIFGFFVYQGARSVDYANRLLMIGLIISYSCITLLLSKYVQPKLLVRHHWPALLASISIVSTSFGFHIIIPTLTDYLKRDVKQIRKAIFIGGFIPLIVYSVWQLIIMGIVPYTGINGLAEGYAKGLDGASVVSAMLPNQQLGLLARIFSLMAIITSFLGVSLSLRDFLADGLHIHKDTSGRLSLYFLTFIPPFIITTIDPRAFINALEYAGAFGVLTLLAIFPVLMVWKGRYIQQREGPYRAPGGKCALAITFILAASMIVIEIAHKSGYVF